MKKILDMSIEEIHLSFRGMILRKKKKRLIYTMNVVMLTFANIFE